MSYYSELNNFLNFANNQTIGLGVEGLQDFNANYLKIYQDLKVKVGQGLGRAAHIPYIPFLGAGQSTKKGIYPAYLYYKSVNTLILAYGISETEIPENFLGC